MTEIYETSKEGVIPPAIVKMMVEEYEPDTYNQESALFSNLEELAKSHEVLREKVNMHPERITKMEDLPEFKTGFYQYKDNTYVVFGTNNIKCSITGEWVIGVNYISVTNNKGYCAREVKDFLNKFTYTPDYKMR